MTQTTTAVAQQGNGTLAKQPKGIDLLKGMLNADSVRQQFNNALGKNAGTFIASVIDLYNSDSKLQQCEPKQVVMEALKAAILKLPINKALGYAYIIPYSNSKKVEVPNENGKPAQKWVKVLEPTFQMGYKGYIQLAMRTGQYKTINADAVYEGELRKTNKLTGEISFDGERKSDKVVGYFCYIELLNGFSKTLYMTVEQMATHAKKYSKALKGDSNTTVDSLLALASLPVAPDSTAVGWIGNFHGMAIKTVIRNLLSKYGYLSIEMQNAITDDYKGESDEPVEEKKPIVIAPENIDYKEVGNVTSEEKEPAEAEEVDPGY